MPLRSKSQLIELMSGVQVLLLAIALVVFGGWIQNRIGRIIREQILEENQLIARQLGRMLRTVHSGNLVFGDANWEKFQAFVEETKLPNDGYMARGGSSATDLDRLPSVMQYCIL